MLKRLRHFGMPVKDLGSAMERLTEQGLTLIYKGEETWGGKKLKIAKFRYPANGQVLEIVEGDWPPHIAIEVKELDAFISLLIPLGVNVLLPVTTKNGDRVAFCQMRIELVEVGR